MIVRFKCPSLGLPCEETRDDWPRPRHCELCDGVGCGVQPALFPGSLLCLSGNFTRDINELFLQCRVCWEASEGPRAGWGLPESPGGTRHLEVRALSCRVDPTDAAAPLLGM